MKRRLTRMGNRVGVWLYRALDGRLAGGRRDVRVLLVRGAGAGAPRDPDWSRNLRAADTVGVQVGTEHVRVRPREPQGAERDTVWRDIVLVQAPEVAKYARTAGPTTIPVAVLERI